MTGVFRFDEFELRPAQRLLMRHGRPVHTGGRALDLLVALVANHHRVVDRHELIDRCWPGQAVEPNNLAVQVWALRRLLGAGTIVTVPGRGYQFTALMVSEGAAAEAALVTPSTASAMPSPQAPFAQNTTLFARQAELQRLRARVATQRLVTLLGPRGVGKTCLALAVVTTAPSPWADTVVVVDLAPVDRPEAVARAIRQALGIAAPVASSAAGQWAPSLRDRSLLLVLDNCERVSAAVADTVRQLLAGAPGVHILVTSQVPLYLPQEQRVKVAPLPVPDDESR